MSIPIYRAQVRKAMAAEGAALLGSVLTAQKIYYAEHNTYTTDSNNLNISATGNRYFTSYAITAADANGFTAQTTGTGDAAGITVTLTYTNAAGSTISYSGI
ncbi:MAG: hypothetical protein N3D17_02375 [bacterium]|nr:hypothetical protein [bacterium]